MATKQNQSKVWIVLGIGVLLLAGLGVGLFVATGDPCASKRKSCYDECPTVIGAKQVCRELCNYDYDSCRDQHRNPQKNRQQKSDD